MSVFLKVAALATRQTRPSGPEPTSRRDPTSCTDAGRAHARTRPFFARSAEDATPGHLELASRAAPDPPAGLREVRAAPPTREAHSPVRYVLAGVPRLRQRCSLPVSRRRYRLAGVSLAFGSDGLERQTVRNAPKFAEDSDAKSARVGRGPAEFTPEHQTMAVLAADLGATPRELHRAVAGLKQAGRVRAVGQRAHTRYFPLANSSAA